MRAVESCQHGVEILAGLCRGQAAQAVVAAELDDDYFGMQAQDRAQACNGIFGGCAAGAVVAYPIVVAAFVQVAFERVWKRLAGLQAVARSDAVAIADKQGPGDLLLRNQDEWRKENQTKRNKQGSANVHIISVAKDRELGLAFGRFPE